MKTKFIEGTDKKYSIREDGVFIRNYKSYKNKHSSGIIKTKKILKSGKKGRVYTSDGVFYIKSLLLEYFKIRICKICNKNFDTDNVNVKVCSECTRKRVNKKNKEWRDKNPEKIKLSRKKYKVYMIETLSDSYIRDRLKVTLNDGLPQEVIIAKREQLKLHRAIKSIKNEHTKRN